MTCTTAMLSLHPVICWISSCWRTLAQAQGQPHPVPWVLLLMAVEHQHVEVVALQVELVRIHVYVLYTLFTTPEFNRAAWDYN